MRHHSVSDRIARALGVVSAITFATFLIAIAASWAGETLARVHDTVSEENDKLDAIEGGYWLVNRTVDSEPELLALLSRTVGPAPPSSGSIFEQVIRAEEQQRMRLFAKSVAAETQADVREAARSLGVEDVEAAQNSKVLCAVVAKRSALCKQARAAPGRYSLGSRYRTGGWSVGKLEAERAQLGARIGRLGEEEIVALARMGMQLRAEVDDAVGRNPVRGVVDTVARALGRASVAGGLTATVVLLLLILGLVAAPLLAVLLILRTWKPSTRLSYALRASVWTIAFAGWPAIAALHSAIDGCGRSLLEQLAVRAWQGVIASAGAFVGLFWIGCWLGKRRFPTTAPDAPAR